MEKIYYSISEVADLTGVTQSKLRFWENEFAQLKPKRNEKATRFYVSEDIDLIKQIIYLTENQKLTLDGAKQKLRDKKSDIVKKQQIVERLQNIKKELQGIARNLS
ncbi:MAG: MerR family transcriptional regulator [Prevotellaceae bacterium]|jgi:DNA-binding transcriptional MerR regulator|nr:MerR family transcriptional regulator [Prevotellaceae bacterium]